MLETGSGCNFTLINHNVVKEGSHYDDELRSVAPQFTTPGASKAADPLNSSRKVSTLNLLSLISLHLLFKDIEATSLRPKSHIPSKHHSKKQPRNERHEVQSPDI